MKQFEIEIARRLALGENGRKSSPAVRVAQISVALSIAVMLIAIGIVSGFKKEITRKITGINPYITLYPVGFGDEDRATIKVSDGLEELLDAQPYIIDWQPAVNVLALLKTSDNFKGLYVNGLSPSADASFLNENLVAGSLPDFGNRTNPESSLLISQKTADELSLQPGDSINVYSFGTTVVLKRMKVSGVYDTHMEMFDNALAFTPISMAASLGGYGPKEASAINIAVTDLEAVPDASADLSGKINADLSGSTIMLTSILDNCRGILGWLGMLDTNVWVILVLLTLVSAFTLISGMLIIILEKVRFIGVMKSLGASSLSIRRVFVWLAMRIGVRGMIGGTIIGLTLLALQYYLRIVKLDADAYYMNYAPVDFPWLAFGAVETGFAVIIYLVLTIPSRLVSRISPSESMRFD